MVVWAGQGGGGGGETMGPNEFAPGHQWQKDQKTSKVLSKRITDNNN